MSLLPRTEKASKEHPRYQNTVTLAFANGLEQELIHANKTIKDLQDRNLELKDTIQILESQIRLAMQ